MSDFGMSDDELEQMYQEVILDAARNPHGKESFAQDLVDEASSAAGETTLRASHEYCTPGNPTSSIRPAATRSLCTSRSVIRIRAASSA